MDGRQLSWGSYSSIQQPAKRQRTTNDWDDAAGEYQPNPDHWNDQSPGRQNQPSLEPWNNIIPGKRDQVNLEQWNNAGIYGIGNDVSLGVPSYERLAPRDNRIQDQVNLAHWNTEWPGFQGQPNPQHNRYTIAWICALHIELAAASAMLDEVHEAPRIYANDSNTYRLGKIGRHHVVLACLPNAEYGTNNAANVVTNLLRTFPSIRLGLMVGIGGGVPSMVDIRLGDVVVGTRVMQYDAGKILQDGEIKRTAIPRTPHPLFGTSVSTLRADHEFKPSRIASILRERLGNHAGFSRPESPDILFASTYQHVSSRPSCDDCDTSNLLHRRERQSRDPVIHYGIIASGNQVMRSSSIRDTIAQDLDAICFEMEAAGLMATLPVLPIRGVCDYSDSHKNKEWQRYAAATAAAYARELLEILPSSEAQVRVPYAPNAQQHLPADRRHRLLESLKYEQMDSRKLTIKAAHAKTCRWFLKHPDYQAWLDPAKFKEHRGFLWIRGKPGAGKSTIMKFIYTQTKKKANGTLIASFFFNARGEQLEKTISGMYRSLLLQLLENYPDLQSVLDDPDLVPSNQSGCPSLSMLMELFSNAVAGLGQRSFTCFIDALDECDEQQVRTMVQDLEELADRSTENGINLRICFSSRHYPYIVIRHGIQLTLECQTGHAEDMANYVKSRLEIGDTTLVEDIIGKAAGVFLWVVLVVDILNKENRRGRLALKKRFAELPSSLSELFKDMLQRDQENMEDLLLCILWILYAKRPLKPAEYYHALWSGLYLKGLADEEIPDVNGSDAVDTINRSIINSSKGLAETTKSKQPTVQFIHESVRDFLIKDKGLHQLWPNLGINHESLSHETLKECCNIYINHPSICAYDSASEDRTELTEVSNRWPFLDYAVQHILSHSDSAAVAISQDNFISTFPIPRWVHIYNMFEKFVIRRYTEGVSLLYILAEKNLIRLIRSHPDRISCFDTDGLVETRYGPPIFAAIALGNHEAVQTFLEILAQIQPAHSALHGLYTHYSQNPKVGMDLGRTYKFSSKTNFFRYFTQNGAGSFAGFLLYYSGNIDITANKIDKYGRKPLSYAAQFGPKILVQLLLQKDTSPHSTSREGRTPFSYAAESGQNDIVQFLFENGADPNIKDHDDRTALWHAAHRGQETITRILLENKADPNIKDKNGQTPLFPATRLESEEIAKLLLAKNVNFDIKDQNNRTPLSYAAASRYGNVGRLLFEQVLKKGGDFDTKCDDGRTPLSYASQSGCEAFAILLCEAGADPDSSSNHNKTPLIYAAGSGKEALVRFLLSKGVGPDTKDSENRTPLSYTASGGNAEIVRMLLATQRVEPDCKNNAGITPLSYAASGGNAEIVRLLLATQRVEPNFRSNAGITPLSYAASRGNEEIVRMLLATQRVKLDSRSNEGRTPLSYAASGGNAEIVRMLLATQRVEPDSKDEDGCTPLMYAVYYQRTKVVQLLLATKRVDVDAKVFRGMCAGETPLTQAHIEKDPENIRLLSEYKESIAGSVETSR